MRTGTLALWLLICTATAAMADGPGSCTSSLLRSLMTPQEASTYTFERLPGAHTYPLPESFKELIKKSPLMELRKNYGTGQGWVFELQHYPEGGKLDSAHFGEELQSSFIGKIIQEVLPEAELRSGYEYLHSDRRRLYQRWLEKHPGKKRIYLHVNDQAELRMAPTYAAVNMPVAKAANPGIAGLEHGVLRKSLSIPEEEKVVSFYVQHFSGLGKSGEVPSVEEMLQQLEKSHHPDLIFVSKAGNTSSPASFGSSVKAKYEVHLLSEFSEVDRVKGKRYIFVNDLRGQLPALYNVSDLAVVCGPVNYFEPLTAGTKTLIFNNPTAIGKYDRASFDKMLEQALATGGAYPVASLKEVEARALEASKSLKPILPPFSIPDADGSPAERLFKHLRKAIDEGQYNLDEMS